MNLNMRKAVSGADTNIEAPDLLAKPGGKVRDFAVRCCQILLHMMSLLADSEGPYQIERV